AQDPSVPRVLHGHAAAVRARGLHARAPLALPFAAGLLPAEARPLRRAARGLAIRAVAGARYVFSACRLRTNLVRARYRVRAPAHVRARRRRDSDLGVLRGTAARGDARALLLRKAGADPARGRGEAA